MRSAAPHVVAVVPSSGVVGDEPGVGFGLELADRGEVPAVEGRAPALLEDGAVEALADSVVVGRAGRDALVTQSLGDEVGSEVGRFCTRGRCRSRWPGLAPRGAGRGAALGR